jgi:succinate dehydrogenase / fumarate reductase flavoprotein subunit
MAGMRAALAAKAAGADVAIVSKQHPMRSMSSGVHGGINAALKGGDSWEGHAQDTVSAGAYLNDQDAVEAMCKDATDDVLALEHMGVVFSRNGDGRIDVVSFPGSGKARTAYAGDTTGHVIQQVLFEQVLRHQIPVYSEWFVEALLVEGGICRGVAARDLKSGRLEAFTSRATILATGGFGRMYAPSTASLAATGDGVALAYRAGASLQDMEMVQFAPATLKSRGLLITDMARSLGGKVVDKGGNEVVGAGATRDAASRAAAEAISEGRGENGYVFLDLRGVDKKVLSGRLRETRMMLKDLEGLDPSKDLIPVKPAMHRPIGGIKTDTQGATSVSGLYAAGECASNGAHGAGRLGGNSILDSAVSGRRAGESAAGHAKEGNSGGTSASLVGDVMKGLEESLASANGDILPGTLARELASVMNGTVGITRDASGLEEASKAMGGLRERYGRAVAKDAGQYREVGNMLDVASAIVASALAREESRGSHYRTDFPNRDDKNWLKHTVVNFSSEGPKVGTEAVKVGKWKPKG